MKDKSLWFEVIAIVMLLTNGLALVSVNLPGWGLVGIAGLLAVISITLRIVNEKKVPVPVAAKAV